MADLRITNDSCSGDIRDHGAQVTAWTPVGMEPVVWLSEHAIFREGVAIRGGVPVCFPWFGGGPEGDRKPAHGFARITDWHRVSVEEDGTTTSVVHELTDGDMKSPEFPHPFRSTLAARFGSNLHVSLEVRNTGAEDFTFEAALHTYLAVGDARSITLEGLDGDAYYDQVTGVEARQSGPIVVAGEVDRVYRSDSVVRVVDPMLGRVVTVGKSGSSSTVVWNPWIEKSRRMSDFGDDEWQRMVCVETANVKDDAVSLAPGQSHLMSMSLSVAFPPG
jgi:glucose-6-phosphate 1-epimerase